MEGTMKIDEINIQPWNDRIIEIILNTFDQKVFKNYSMNMFLNDNDASKLIEAFEKSMFLTVKNEDVDFYIVYDSAFEPNAQQGFVIYRNGLNSWDCYLFTRDYYDEFVISG